MYLLSCNNVLLIFSNLCFKKKRGPLPATIKTIWFLNSHESRHKTTNTEILIPTKKI